MPSVERSGRAASNPRAPYLWLFDTKAPATFTPPGLTRRLGPQPGDMTSFGRRRSLLGHPVPAGELGPPHGRLTEHAQGRARTPTGLPRSAHTSSDREGRPLYPGDNGAHPDRGDFRPGARRFAAASPCTPPHIPSTRFSLNEANEGSQVFARPVFPSPVAARMERAALGLSPWASHPADQEPDNARQGGDRPSSTDLGLHAQLIRRSPIR